MSNNPEPPISFNRLPSNRSRCAIASACRPCASIRPKTAWRPTGIWCIWGRARSAARDSSSPRRRRFRRKAASRRATRASGRTNTSSRLRASTVSSNNRRGAGNPDCPRGTQGVRDAPVGRRCASAETGGWQTLAPSPLPFGGELNKIPRAMTEADIVKCRMILSRRPDVRSPPAANGWNCIRRTVT